MRRSIMILLFPTLLIAQSYSRWNYSDELPNGSPADAKLIADFSAMLNNHATGDISIHKSYRYPSRTDSSFELHDITYKIIRLFDPVSASDGVTELAREDTVILLSKHSPFTSRVIVGGDGILPAAQKIIKANQYIMYAAQVEAKALRKAVDDTMKIDKKLKRKNAWLAVKKAKKDKKIKESKVQSNLHKRK